MLVAWKSIILIALVLFIEDSLQIVRDESFLRFCDNVGGDKVLSPTGDTCTVVWKFPASDAEEAEDYCKTWGAYPLQHHEVVDGQPKCTYVNVYECIPAYTLIKGYCYRMAKKENEMQLYDDAEKTCNGYKNTQVFKQFDVDQIRFIRAYFSNLRGFWVQSEVDPVTKQKQINRAVVFGMAGLYRGAGPGDVIQLPDNARAQVMCYYKPLETPLSFAVKAKLLGPHYFPTVIDGYMAVWRTTGFYSAMISRDRMEAQTQCELSMRAIVGKGVARVWDATVENVKRLTDGMKNNFIQSYIPFFTCYWTTRYWDRDYKEYFTNHHYTHYSLPKGGSTSACSSLGALSESTYGATNWQRPTADMIYTNLLYSKPSEGYNMREHIIAHYAPILCSIDYTELARPTKCLDGWTPFTRGYGRVVCHKLFEIAKTYEDAKRHCTGELATLSIFTSEQEFEVLKTLGGKPLASRWLGFKKRVGCPRISEGKCSPLSIIEFVDDEYAEDTPQAREIIDKMWNKNADGTYIEPNNYGRDEYCVELRDTTKLNDLPCTNAISFACMRGTDPNEPTNN